MVVLKACDVRELKTFERAMSAVHMQPRVTRYSYSYGTHAGNRFAIARVLWKTGESLNS